MTIIAKAQASKYLGGEAMRDGRKIAKLGPANAFEGKFTINCLDNTYQVTYTTPSAGVVLYHVKEIGKRTNANYYITEKEFPKLKDLIDEKMRQRAPGTAVSNVITAAAAGVGVGLLAYGGGGGPIRCSDRALYFN